MFGLSLTWPWNPGVILFLLLLAALYMLGLRHAQRHPLAVEDGGIAQKHIIAFFSAIGVMAVVLLTPIDTIAHTQLFSVHMARLVLLVTLCAPLILYGSPAIMVRPLLQLPVVGFILRTLTRPVVASLLFNLLFLLWHAPRILHTTFDNNALYHTLVLSIFVASLLNWWPLLGSVRDLRPMGYPIQMLYAFFDGQPVDIFAFILVFTGVTVYPYYAVPASLGLSTFADQAIGGALLLIPGLVDLVVMTPLFFRWLGQIENQTKRADQEREEDEYEIEYEEDEVEA